MPAIINKEPFYSPTLNRSLIQGDVLENSKIDIFKNQPKAPSFWMVITKDCDLQVDTTNNEYRHKNVSLLAINKVTSLFEPVPAKNQKILFAAIQKLSDVSIKRNAVNELIRNKLSRFAYLPPEGNILHEPMAVDFNLIHSINANKAQDVTHLENAKVLQLDHRFRLFIAQRFASHFSSIGIDDDEIRSKDHEKIVKEYIT